MDPIHETHVSKPGLVVVDVAAADEATALACQQLLADRWATATAEQTTRDAGQPGVRLRCYLDLRRQLTATAVVGPTMEPTTARALTHDRAPLSPNSGTSWTSTSARMRCGRAGRRHRPALSRASWPSAYRPRAAE
ncbi:DUF6207 family protein [Streptomyces kanasensis]